MAAQVSAGDDCHVREVAGVSYANAVLNLKNMDNNKENIDAECLPAAAQKDHGFKEVCRNKSSAAKLSARHQLQMSQHGSARKDEFPQMVPPGRVGRRVSAPVASPHRHVQNGPVNGNCASHEGAEREDRDGSEDPADEADKVAEKIKYVEAPIPKVNPWTAHKNAAQVITGKPAPSRQQVAQPPPSTEKRVLQPQQQGRVDVNEDDHSDGEWVLINYDGMNYPGEITSTFAHGVQESVMHPAADGTYKWPSLPDKLLYHFKDVMKKIGGPWQSGSRAAFFLFLKT